MRVLIFAVTGLLASAASIGQDSQDFFVPDLGSDAVLMAELVEAKVSFVEPAGIREVNDMLIGMSNKELLYNEQVTVPTAPGHGGAKIATVQPEMKTAASLSVRAAPGQPITIYVDEVNAGDGYSLADFRCNYNAGDDFACDGSGFSDVSVASGMLLVGATLTADGNSMSGPGNGSFDITISYQ